MTPQVQQLQEDLAKLVSEWSQGGCIHRALHSMLVWEQLLHNACMPDRKSDNSWIWLLVMC
jgi:hypothetical protein